MREEGGGGGNKLIVIKNKILNNKISGPLW